MSLNIQQIVAKLGQRVDKLEEENTELRALVKKIRNVSDWRHKRFRAELIRLSVGASGERWHVGGAYTRGSRIRIPSRPKILDMIPRRVRAKDRLEERSFINDRLHGIPRQV